MRRGWLVVGACACAWACTGAGEMPLVPEDAGVDAADASVDAPLDAGSTIDVGPLPEPLPPCDVTVPEALLARPGLQPDGSFLTLDGRRARAAGMRVILDGFPAQVRLHPTARVAYVVVSGTDDRRLDVIGLDDLTVRQSIEREVFHGLALRSDGSALFVGGGHDGELTRYSVSDDGTLTESTSVDLDAYLAGLALSDDGARVYVGSFDESAVLELDAETLALRRRLPIAPRFGGLWDLVVVPEREQLYASDLGGSGVAVLDLSTGTQLATVLLPVSPAGLVATRDTVFAAVSGSDMVAAIDVATRSVVATSEVFDAALVDDGEPLPNGNVNALFHDAASDRLYVSRGADNAISVLTATTLTPLGAIPSDWYPTDVALAADGRTLVISSGRGEGSGPNEGQSAKAVLRGTVTVVDLLGLDLEAETTRASENLRRTVELYRPTCEAFLERILGVPPVGRPDAAAAPLYDFFTTTPDFTPYDARERLHPRELNGETTVGADRSREMDFRSPDRNPDLGALVRAYRAWRRGEIERDEAERRIERAAREALHEDADAAIDEAAIERAKGDRDELVDEAAVERAAFDHEWPRYVQWHLERYGVAPAEPPGAPTRIRRPD